MIIARRRAALDRNRPQRILDGGLILFAKPGDPDSLQDSLRSRRRRGDLRSMPHHGHGGGLTRRWFFRQAVSTAARHSNQSNRACDPDKHAASAPNLDLPLLRIAQGLCMRTLFALTIAYLGEQCSAMMPRGILKAYITAMSEQYDRPADLGSGRETLGLASNLYFFEMHNLAARRWCISPLSASSDEFDGKASLAAGSDDRNKLSERSRMRRRLRHGFCICSTFIGTSPTSISCGESTMSLGMMS